MVSALLSFIKADKVIFGARECVKNAKKIQKVLVPTDIRPASLAQLEKSKLNVESLEVSKRDVMEKLSLAFSCEAFGVLK